MKYASIVPLIGGETIAMEQVFKSKPEYMVSYEPFMGNDVHIVEHYKKAVPYHILQGTQDYKNFGGVDVVNTVCPCAGLSSLSPSASTENASNDWLSITSEYVLGHVQPTVFWGENAPRLGSKMGEPIVKCLREIGKKNGYTFSIFKTKSLLHGLSQTRDRVFYFFWKSETVPLFEYIKRPHQRIEEAIRSVDRLDDDPMNIPTNKKTPSDDPYYKYVLEEIEGGITHKQFSNKITKSANLFDWIELHTKYNEVSKWMNSKGYEREAARCDRMYKKLDDGFNIMRKGVEVPKDYIGAFVGHLPHCLTHPDEDRYLTVREAMEVMKLPRDFVLQGGVKNLNHICQNVPVTTAADMASQIKKYLEGGLDRVETDFLIQNNKNQTHHYEKVPNTLEAFI